MNDASPFHRRHALAFGAGTVAAGWLHSQRLAEAAQCPPGSTKTSAGICMTDNPTTAEVRPPGEGGTGNTVLPSGVRYRDIDEGTGNAIGAEGDEGGLPASFLGRVLGSWSFTGQTTC